MTTDTAAAMFRAALVPTLVVGAGAVVLGGLLVGSSGVWGALIGVLVVVVFFALGVLVLGRLIGREPAFALVAAMGLYVGKVVVIGGMFIFLDATGALSGFADHLVLGLTVIACTLAWTAGEMVGAVRARQPVYDLDNGQG
jgi:ATP synthase protein I